MVRRYEGVHKHARLTEEIANELEVIRGSIIERICFTIPQKKCNVEDNGHKESELMRWE